jgi:riboflavin synthase
VCVDGVSLTVTGKGAGTFAVSLVQYTREHTNLLDKHPGDAVNIETDIIARYVESILAAR